MNEKRKMENLHSSPAAQSTTLPDVIKKTDNPDGLDSLIDRSPVHYGWVILIVGTIGIIMSSPGQTYSFSIFIEQFINDLGLSRSLVSSLYAVGTIVGSLALPFIGRAIDKRGNRRMVVIITLAFTVACFYMGFVRNGIMLMIGIIFMRMLGQSSMVLVSNNVINQWWVRRRGFVTGISILVAAMLGVGMFPNLINWLIPRTGWRGAYFVLGGMVFAIMLPVGAIFFRERPEKYGLSPDGDIDKAVMADVEEHKFDEQSMTRSEAIRTTSFWLICLGISAFAMLNTGLTFHIVSIFADNGLSADLAAAIFLPMSLSTSLFSIPGGWIVDRIGIKYVLAFGLALLTTTILISTSIVSPLFALFYGIIAGLGSGTARIVGAVAYANYFGRKHLGAITGFASTIGAVASGLGPPLYGIGRDLSGDYWPTLLVSAFYPATMVVLVLLFLRRPRV